MHLGFLGYVTLEDTLRLALQCVNGSLVASAPDAAPTWSIYTTSDTAVKTGSLGSSDADSKTGFRTGDAAITAANGFASGDRCIVRFAWAVSATSYAATAEFCVL